MALEKAKMKLLFGAVVGAFTLSGPLQHTGLLPKSPVGDMSISALKFASGVTIQNANASCGGFGDQSGGGSNNHGFFGNEIRHISRVLSHFF